MRVLATDHDLDLDTRQARRLEAGNDAAGHVAAVGCSQRDQQFPNRAILAANASNAVPEFPAQEGIGGTEQKLRSPFAIAIQSATGMEILIDDYVVGALPDFAIVVDGDRCQTGGMERVTEPGIEMIPVDDRNGCRKSSADRSGFQRVPLAAGRSTHRKTGNAFAQKALPQRGRQRRCGGKNRAAPDLPPSLSQGEAAHNMAAADAFMAVSPQKKRRRIKTQECPSSGWCCCPDLT